MSSSGKLIGFAVQIRGGGNAGGNGESVFGFSVYMLPFGRDGSVFGFHGRFQIREPVCDDRTEYDVFKARMLLVGIDSGGGAVQPVSRRMRSG